MQRMRSNEMKNRATGRTTSIEVMRKPREERISLVFEPYFLQLRKNGKTKNFWYEKRFTQVVSAETEL
jgi:hypothetical protein